MKSIKTGGTHRKPIQGPFDAEGRVVSQEANIATSDHPRASEGYYYLNGASMHPDGYAQYPRATGSPKGQD